MVMKWAAGVALALATQIAAADTIYKWEVETENCGVYTCPTPPDWYLPHFGDFTIVTYDGYTIEDIRGDLLAGTMVGLKAVAWPTHGWGVIDGQAVNGTFWGFAHGNPGGQTQLTLFGATQFYMFGLHEAGLGLYRLSETGAIPGRPTEGGLEVATYGRWVEVPEPATFGLLALGLGFLFRRRR